MIGIASFLAGVFSGVALLYALAVFYQRKALPSPPSVPKVQQLEDAVSIAETYLSSIEGMAKAAPLASKTAASGLRRMRVALSEGEVA